MRRMFSNKEVSRLTQIPLEEVESWSWETCHEECIIGGIRLDVGIVDIVRKLWLHGVKTTSSCQGGPTECDYRMTDAAVVIEVESLRVAKELLPFAKIDLRRLGDKLRYWLHWKPF